MNRRIPFLAVALGLVCLAGQPARADVKTPSFISDGMESIHKATGQTPVGWNAYYVRNTPHTFDILQSLGFKYHIDEPSADEPLIIKLKGGDFVTVPYTIHMNDIASFTFEGWNPAAYEQALKDEFDQLYEEGAHRRRMRR